MRTVVNVGLFQLADLCEIKRCAPNRRSSPIEFWGTRDVNLLAIIGRVLTERPDQSGTAHVWMAPETVIVSSISRYRKPLAEMTVYNERFAMISCSQHFLGLE